LCMDLCRKWPLALATLRPIGMSVSLLNYIIYLLINKHTTEKHNPRMPRKDG
jgi:hypothetical protein